VKDVQDQLDKRRPVNSHVSTSRREEEEVELLSGIYQGHTTGAPICMLVWNRDVKSEMYKELRFKPRPGHADYPASVKYAGFNDNRGGGRFSGRLTAAFVMAGAVAKKVLDTRDIEVLAHTVEIGGVIIQGHLTVDDIRKRVYTNVVRCAEPEAAREMGKTVSTAKKEGDSCGGIVECIVLNLPVGIGDPIFDTLDGDLAKALFTIPAVKGVEFGAGFSVSKLKGSENNDHYFVRNGKIVTKTNNSGGILGGMSNGMPVILRVAFKPTPSIAKEQRTVDLARMIETPIQVRGRHDTCIVPRAVPVVESIVALTLVDHILRAETVCRWASKARLGET
jgi:chorismate synthase